VRGSRLFLLAGLLLSDAVAVEVETTFENSNFTLSTPLEGTGERVWANYNRFRITGYVTEGNWFATVIGDVEHYLGQDYIHSAAYRAASAVRSDTPFATQTGTQRYGEGELFAQLYRLYGGYVDGKNRLSVGLQKVSMGVGRLWNPTDLFNPKNPLALEPDEVFGNVALVYTYTISELSQATGVVAQREDETFKYAGRLKGNVASVDMALNAVSADDVEMLGYELEGELGESGVGLRSEGGWFRDKLLGTSFFQGLIGADYVFENSLMLAGEWLHTSRSFDAEPGTASGAPANLVRAKDYLGMNAGYDIDPLLYSSLSLIVSAGDGSFYLAPLLSYSLADDATLAAGAMLYGGSSGSEFGDYLPTLYLNLKITF
jgi:hypothetical protein